MVKLDMGTISLINSLKRDKPIFYQKHSKRIRLCGDLEKIMSLSAKEVWKA